MKGEKKPLKKILMYRYLGMLPTGHHCCLSTLKNRSIQAATGRK